MSWRVGEGGGIKRAGGGLRLEGKWTAFGANGQVLDETLTKR